MTIPTEPIGSIPRPLHVLEAVEKVGDSEHPDLSAMFEEAIRDTIERFEATGSPVITDGEQRKYHNFWTYCVHGMRNTSPDGFRIPFAAGHVRRMPRLTSGPFRYRTRADRYLEIAQRYAHVPVKQAVISPSALSLMYPEEGLPGYPRDRFIDDLIREHETEIRACLKNAIKFTPAQGTISVRSYRSDDGGHIIFEINDTGIGMEAGDVERVFQAFEQGDQKIARQFGGLGLGLAISRAIAEAHRGTLDARSEGKGRGSTFTLTLPCVECGNPAVGISPLQKPTSPPVAIPVAVSVLQRPLRILLVEDHADTAAVLARLLRRMGHDVVHADRIAQAIEFADREMQGAGIDLLMSDLGLPDGSGQDLMRALAAKYEFKGIALSGYGMDSDLEQSTAAGFSRHLIKPVDIALLRHTISELMHG